MKLQLAAYALRAVRRAERIRLPSGPSLAYSIAVLVAMGFLISAANLLFTAHYVNSTQAAARRQGELVERRLCTTLDRLAVLRPPPGNPVTNPSRAFDQHLHATLSQLGPDLGCR